MTVTGALVGMVVAFVATAALGMVASWIDRKVTARVHYRVGPPFFQPLYDVVKLLGKETIVPAEANIVVFLGAPLAGLAAITLVAFLLGQLIVNPGAAVWGDVIVAIYLMTVPSLALIIGASASRNPLASLGASREMKMVLAYELPFILAVAVAVIKTKYAMSLGMILANQAAGGAVVGSLSGALALIIAIIVTQAKLGLVPFDAPEAETEIMGGVLIEYSGTALAVFKLMRLMMLVTVPVFVVTVFCGGIRFDQGIGAGIADILKYVGLLVAAVLIRNTNPRLRIDQALKFFWGPVTVLGLIAVVLALVGL